MSDNVLEIDAWTPYATQIGLTKLLMLQCARYFEAQRNCEHCQREKEKLDAEHWGEYREGR